MRIPTRKSRLQRLLDTAGDSLSLRSRSKSRLPSIGSGNGLPAGLSTDKAVKAGLIAGGFAGLTAASAGISSLRRSGRARDES